MKKPRTPRSNQPRDIRDQESKLLTAEDLQKVRGGGVAFEINGKFAGY